MGALALAVAISASSCAYYPSQGSSYGYLPYNPALDRAIYSPPLNRYDIQGAVQDAVAPVWSCQTRPLSGSELGFY